MKKLVLLDIDDTLVDQSGAERTAAREFGRRFQDEIAGYDPETFPERWHEITMRHYEEFLAHSITYQEQRRRRLRDIFSVPSLTEEEADQRYEVYLRFYIEAWSLFPEVPEFFDANRGLRFAALSDGSQRQQEYKLEKLGIRPHFEFIVTAESAGMSKPAAEFFHLACDRAQSRPSETSYIGDNLEKDALGAIDAGLKGVWLNRAGDGGAAVPTIRRLTDFAVG